MTDKLRQAAQQMLEAVADLTILTPREWQAVHGLKINALRAALAEQPVPSDCSDSHRPIAWLNRDQLDELQSCNGMSIWAESPQMYAPLDPCNAQAPSHLVAVYLTNLLTKPAEQEPVAVALVRPLEPEESERRVTVKWVKQPITGPLYTAPQPAIPQGYKLVPVEPTIDMLRSGVQRELADASHYGRLRDTYRAMLAAAPEEPQPAKREPLTTEEKVEIQVQAFGPEN